MGWQRPSHLLINFYSLSGPVLGSNCAKYAQISLKFDPEGMRRQKCEQMRIMQRTTSLEEKNAGFLCPGGQHLQKALEQKEGLIILEFIMSVCRTRWPANGRSKSST